MCSIKTYKLLNIDHGGYMHDATEMANGFLTQKTNPLIELENLSEKIKTAENVFISTCLDRAYREAQAAKERWRAANPLSIFDGVPIAWKDLFDVNGLNTTAGSITQQSKKRAKSDAVLVQQLTRLGLVNIGKTNLTEFAYSGLGINPHYGTPKNIHNSSSIPGGSSSGAAISVGLGIVPISIGTDTAGSVRIPAALNGLVGFKSSKSRYSKIGVFPLAQSLDSIGPITRSVRDCIALDNLLIDQEKYYVSQLKQQHFCIDVDFIEQLELDEYVRHNFFKVVGQLKKAGARVEFKKINGFRQSISLINEGLWLGAAEAYTCHQELLESDESVLIDSRVRKRLECAKNILASTQIKLYQAALDLKLLIREELNGACMLTPTVAHTAPAIQPLLENDELFVQTNLKILKLTMPGSYLNMPGVALPNGFDQKKLPTSILVSSYEENDRNVLQSAEFIEYVIKGI